MATASAGTRPAFVALSVVAAAACLYWPQLSLLASRWAEAPGASHGWLIATAIPVLIWLDRDSLDLSGGGADWGAIGAGLFAACGFAMASAAGVDVLAALAIPAAAIVACRIAAGRRAGRALAFPLAFFVFAVPIWSALTPALQMLTVRAAGVMLSVLGVHAFIHETLVTTRSGTFEIAGGCAGLHFAVVALATASLLAYTQRLARTRSVALVVLALGVAMLTNWIRVTAIIAIGNATEMRSPLVADHYAFGWALFAVALVPVFLAARALGRGTPDPGVATTPRAAAGPDRPWTPRALILALAVLTLGPAWVFLCGATTAGGTPQGAALPALAGWSGPQAPSFDWQPQFPGASSQRSASYQREATRVDVFVASFDRQAPGHKLIGFDARLANAEWSEDDLRDLQVGPDPRDRVTQRLYANSAGTRRVVWNWYDVRGRRELRPARVKLLQSLSAFGLSSRSGIVILSARCTVDCAAALAALDAAYRAGLGALGPRGAPQPGAS